MFLPIIFIVAGASNAILSFFGAFWEHSEMGRHALIGSIVFRVGVALAATFLVNQLIDITKSKIFRNLT